MNYVVLIGLLYSVTATATDMDTRIKAKYSELHKNAKTFCDFTGDPVSNRIEHLSYKVNPKKSIVTQLLIDGIPATITILPKSKKGEAVLSIDGKSISASIKRSNKLKFNLRELNADFIVKHDLRRLNCFVDIAVADTFELTYTETHINVHPHANYDYRGLTSVNVQNFMEIFPERSLVLLDDSNGKAVGYNLPNFINFGGDHFSVKKFPNPSFEIPENIKMIVAPAGHNRFKVIHPETTIHYTGGNHNYCMLNNTRRIMDGFFHNDDAKVLSFIFYTDSIVAQRKGVISGKPAIPFNIFKIQKKYVLSEIFEAMSSEEVATYKNFFKNFYARDLKGFRHQYFKTLTINYEGERIVLTGSGERELTINFKYK